MDNVKGFVVTEENLAAAINNAPYWARRRLLKKMGKQKHSPKEWHGSFKNVTSPLTGQPLLVLDRSKPHGLASEPRMPKDLEQYVENFTFTYGGMLEEAAAVPSV